MSRVERWHSQRVAGTWDAGVGELPTRAEQQDILLDLLAGAAIGDRAVLDLGIGSGLVAEAILERLPRAHLV